MASADATAGVMLCWMALALPCGDQGGSRLGGAEGEGLGRGRRAGGQAGLGTSWRDD